MTLGELIQSSRERLGISPTELARRAGVSPPTITRIESGEISGRAESLFRIGRVLGIRASEIEESLIGPVANRHDDDDGIVTLLRQITEASARLEKMLAGSGGNHRESSSHNGHAAKRTFPALPDEPYSVRRASGAASAVLQGVS